MRIPRAVLRVLALTLLAALLVGVPVVVFQLLGVPLPGVDGIRDAWHNRQIDGDLVIRVGAGVFALLWVWFAATAVTELWHAMSWRLGRAAGRLAPLSPGPSGWVRGLVRFIVFSSVSATAALGSLVPLARGSDSGSTGELRAVHSSIGSLVNTSVGSSTASHRAVGRETPYSLAVSIGQIGRAHV